MPVLRDDRPVSTDDSLTESGRSSAAYSVRSFILDVHGLLVSSLGLLISFFTPKNWTRGQRTSRKSANAMKGRWDKFLIAYDRLSDFSVENLFIRKRPPGPRRTVYVNEELPEESKDKKGRVNKEWLFTSNQVITSKYTVLTFLPRNILEQFRRVANMFFLAIAILQFFDKFSTISPGLVILPLLIVVAITGAKDAYEDVKRHQSDNRVNRSHTLVLTGGSWHNPNHTIPKPSDPFHSLNLLRIPNKVSWFSKHTDERPDVEKAAAEEAPPLAPPGDVEFDDPSLAPPKDGEHHHHHIHRPSFLGGHHEHGLVHWKKCMWEDVKVGDFVKIYDNEPLPADILICATSEEENVAYIETKNLDGETNLKSRNAVTSLTDLKNSLSCADSRLTVDCDKPDNNMFRLNAAVNRDGQTVPVDIQTTLLRGTVLRNTSWVIGLVLFTGEDTKIVLNSGGTPSKRSKVERQMNPQVFLNLLILAIMAVVCAIADSVNEHHYFPRSAPWLFWDDRSDDNPSINGLVTWAFALITFQNIVPISLYISIEFVRTCQAAFIYFDSDMYYEKTKQPTLARSWNLSDDLGQIEYIFSDKTGTLTQNSMIFRMCSINGKSYAGTMEVQDAKAPTPVLDKELADQPSVTSDASSSDTATAPIVHKPEVKFIAPELSADIADAVNSSSSADTRARTIHGFFSVLSLCHTVLTGTNAETGRLEYKAQSPDEAALVQAAADVGYAFRGRDRETLSVHTPFSTGPDDVDKYELLNILDFTSARKRMSVIVRKLDDDDNRVFLLMKGADNVVLERLRPGSDEVLKKTTEDHLSEFANNGLRTLTLAYRIVSDEEYATWSKQYHAATVAMENREEMIEEASAAIEHDLRLLGATAIEDSLQEGVPETIADLKRAGIKIWVATGDKLETAIAIGHSTNLIGKESNIIVIRGGGEGSRPVSQQLIGAIEEFFPDSGILEGDGADIKEKALNLGRVSSRRSGSGITGMPPLRRVETGISSIVGEGNGERPGGFILVIDGSALGYAFKDEENKDILLRLAMLCEGVICCRVSPLQKALVVKLVKDGLGTMTLAIGDGANDVSMIQAADVGVGISGEEGLQAVNSSDYAIAQFRFLKKLLLVHGHWSYARNGNMILNFFYKNIVCIGVLWWFQIYCGWSSNYVFEYTYLLFWNSFWTIAPVIAIGLFDRIVDADILMAIPELYKYGREGHWFGMKSFSIYMMDAVIQSAVIFFITLYGYFSPTARSDGYDQHLVEFSTAMVFAAVFTANGFNGMNTAVWTGWVFFAIFLGIALLWLYTIVYSEISPGWFYTPVFGNNRFLFRSPLFWFSVFLTTCVALLPRYISKAYKFGFAPDDFAILRYIRKTNPSFDFTRQNVFIDDEGNAGLKAMRRQPSEQSIGLERRTTRSSVPDAASMRSGRQPSNVDPRSASRTDMSTGIRSVHRGFDFATEEHGVAMQRIQTNLSSRRNLALAKDDATEGAGGKRRTRKGDGDHHRFSIRRDFLKRRPPSS